MRALLAMTARELRERWLLFPASLAVRLQPPRAPCLRRGQAGHAVRRRGRPPLGLGAARRCLMGSTMLARDAANGRLGFLFSRPLSWPTIWGGKWLAALVLVASSGVLAAIPFMAAYPSESHGGSWLRTRAADGPGAALALGAAPAGRRRSRTSVRRAYRSRSPWVALDMVLAAGGAVVHAAARRAPLALRHRRQGRPEPRPGARSRSRSASSPAARPRSRSAGRDLRRAHRAHVSRLLGRGRASTLAVPRATGSWVRSAGPADVERLRAWPAIPEGASSTSRARRAAAGGTRTGSSIDTRRRTLAAASGARPGARCPAVRGALLGGRSRSARCRASDGRGAAIVPPRSRRRPSAGHADQPGVEPASRLERPPSPSRRRPTPSSWPTSPALRSSPCRRAGAWPPPRSRRAGDRRPLASSAKARPAPGWSPGTRTCAPPCLGPRCVSWTSPPTVASKTTVFPIAAAIELPYRSWRAVLPDGDGRRIVTVDAGVHLRDGRPAPCSPPWRPRVTTWRRRSCRTVASSSERLAYRPTSRAAGNDAPRLRPRRGQARRDAARPPATGTGRRTRGRPGRILVSSFRSPLLARTRWSWTSPKAASSSDSADCGPRQGSRRAVGAREGRSRACSSSRTRRVAWSASTSRPAPGRPSPARAPRLASGSERTSERVQWLVWLRRCVMLQALVLLRPSRSRSRPPAQVSPTLLNTRDRSRQGDHLRAGRAQAGVPGCRLRLHPRTARRGPAVAGHLAGRQARRRLRVQGLVRRHEPSPGDVSSGGGALEEGSGREAHGLHGRVQRPAHDRGRRGRVLRKGQPAR